VTDAAAEDRASETPAGHVVNETEARLRDGIADARAVRQIERDQRLLRDVGEGDLHAHVSSAGPPQGTDCAPLGAASKASVGVVSSVPPGRPWGSFHPGRTLSARLTNASMNVFAMWLNTGPMTRSSNPLENS